MFLEHVELVLSVDVRLCEGGTLATTGAAAVKFTFLGDPALPDFDSLKANLTLSGSVTNTATTAGCCWRTSCRRWRTRRFVERCCVRLAG